MTLLYNRSFDSSGGVLDHLYVDTLGVCIASFELFDGGVELLHGARRHRVLWLVAVVLVFVFVCLCRRGVELRVELRERIRNALSVVIVGARLVSHVGYQNFRARGLDGGGAFDATEVAQDVCDCLSSFVAF